MAAAVGILDMPPARGTGRILSTRSDDDQQQINKYAREYFKQTDLETIERLLGKVNLVFDEEEGMMLKTKAGGGGNQAELAFLQDTSANANQNVTRRGILQFYDSCTTIDALKTHMRTGYRMIERATEIQDAEWMNLANEIMFSDYVPANIRDSVPIPERQYLSLIGKQKKQISAAVELPLQAVHPKTDYDRMCDEAVFLKSEILGAAQALSQGLFAVTLCEAYKIVLYPPPVVNNEKLVGGDTVNWVNALNGNINANAPANPAVDGNRLGHWNLNAANANNALVIAPKPTNITVFVRDLIPQADVPYFIPRGAPTRQAGMNSVSAPKGGAIGYYNQYRTANTMFPDQAIGVNDGMRIVETKLADIHRVMASMYNHIVSSCPELSRAYRQSGMHSQIGHMIEMLQRALDAAEVRRRVSSLSTDFKVTNIASIQSSSTSVPQCGPGFTPQFFTKFGNDYKVVPEAEALVSRDGRVELASHVSREKIECVPRVTVAQMNKADVLANIKYQPVLLNQVGAGGAHSYDQPAPQQQVNLQPGPLTFVTSDVDIFGGAMDQYIG